MPAKNSIKEYIRDGYYHIYNRGVEKRDIFVDEQDFAVFLSYLKTYILPKDLPALNAILASKESSASEKDKALKSLHLKNFSSDICLLAFALMENHFHLLIKQAAENAIDSFMTALCTRYVLYFNRKYHRVGPLFQGIYKAVSVTNENQLLHLTRYIHKNPGAGSGLPTSLPDYLDHTRTAWLKPQEILAYFSKTNTGNSYAGFMAESDDGEFIAPIALDLDDS